MEIREGQIIDGRFQIIKKSFQRGGVGEIHLAKDQQGRLVVLKFLLTQDSDKHLDQFKREYQTLLKFSHPHVARVYHFGQHQDHGFIVYEFVDGEQFKLAAQGLSIAKKDLLLIKVLEGLEAIHKAGLLHLDIKSANVLVTKDLNVKIVDFGIAMAREELGADTVCGTPSYIAPEMVLHQGVDNRADLFQFGVLAYQTYTHCYPFPDRNHRDFRDDRKIFLEKLAEAVAKETPPEKPSHFNISCQSYHDAIVLKCLEKNPEDRFGSARAVINALKSHHPEDYEETPESRGSYLIPCGEAPIGKTKEQKILRDGFRKLLKGKQPRPAVFWIYGAEGMGKSHFLKKAKERMEQKIEAISLHYLELPKNISARMTGEVDWIEEWCFWLTKSLAENQKPIVVMIDNIQSLATLEPLLTKSLETLHQRRFQEPLFAGQMPLLICLTAEAKDERIRPYQRAYPDPIEFYFKPFSKEEVREYLTKTPALRHKKIPKNWLDAVYARTEGNPNEIAALLKAQDKKGMLLDLDQEVRIASVEDSSIDFKDEEEVPITTELRLQNILSQLSDFKKETLAWIAVWSFKEVLPAPGLKDLQALMKLRHLLPVLQELVSSKVLLHDKAREIYAFPKYSFWPHLLYKNLAREDREQKHRAIYDTLKDGEPRLFHQVYGFNKPDTAFLKIVLFLSRKSLSQNGQAVLADQLLQRALEVIPKDRTKLKEFFAIKRVEACFYAGHYQEALQIDAGLKFPQQKVPVYSWHLLSIMRAVAILPVLIEQQQFEAALARIAEGLALCETRNDKHYQAILLNFKAELSYKKFYAGSQENQKFLEEAKRIYEQSEVLEQSLHPQQKDLVRNNNLALVLRALGENTDAMAKLEAKHQRLKRNPNVFIEFTVLLAMAETHRSLKNYDRAMVYANEALAMARKTNSGKWILHAHHILAGIYYSKGNFREAIQEHGCCLAANVCVESKAEANLNTLGILIRRGQCYEALEEWHLALENFNAVLYGEPPALYLSLACLGMGRCYLARGNVARADAFLTKAENFIAKLPSALARQYSFEIYRARIQWLLKKGEGKGVSDCLVKMKQLSDTDPSLREDYQSCAKEFAKSISGHTV